MPKKTKFPKKFRQTLEKVAAGRAVNIGLQLAEPDPVEAARDTMRARLKNRLKAALAALRRW